MWEMKKKNLIHITSRHKITTSATGEEEEVNHNYKDYDNKTRRRKRWRRKKSIPWVKTEWILWKLAVLLFRIDFDKIKIGNRFSIEPNVDWNKAPEKYKWFFSSDF